MARLCSAVIRSIPGLSARSEPQEEKRLKGSAVTTHWTRAPRWAPIKAARVWPPHPIRCAPETVPEMAHVECSERLMFLAREHQAISVGVPCQEQPAERLEPDGPTGSTAREAEEDEPGKTRGQGSWKAELASEIALVDDSLLGSASAPRSEERILMATGIGFAVAAGVH